MPAEGADWLREAGAALAATQPEAVDRDDERSFVWETHLANLCLSKRVADLEKRYPGIELGWVVDWARQFIEQVVEKRGASPSEQRRFDERMERMAEDLARRIDATNPELRADGGALQKGLSGGAGTHLWTGGIDYKGAQAAARRAAEAQSEHQYAASVEMTIAGELLDSIVFSGNGVDYASEADNLWNELSRTFAGNARGTVRVHTLYGIRKPSIFYSVESPVLLDLMKAQEERERYGKKEWGPVVDDVVMVIYLRKGELNPETGQFEVLRDERGEMREELVEHHEAHVTTSYKLKQEREKAWDKALAREPDFAVASSVRHRARVHQERAW